MLRRLRHLPLPLLLLLGLGLPLAAAFAINGGPWWGQTAPDPAHTGPNGCVLVHGRGPYTLLLLLHQGQCTQFAPDRDSAAVLTVEFVGVRSEAGSTTITLRVTVNGGSSQEYYATFATLGQPIFSDLFVNQDGLRATLSGHLTEDGVLELPRPSGYKIVRAPR